MADTMNLKFLDLAGLQAYDAKLKGYVDGKDALSLKGLALSEDGKKLLAFRVRFTNSHGFFLPYMEKYHHKGHTKWKRNDLRRTTADSSAPIAERK